MQAHSPLGGEESIQTIGTNVAANSEEDTIEMTKNDKDLFKARLIAVLLEFSDKGINLCNILKSWVKVRPDIPFNCRSSCNQDDNMALRQGSKLSTTTGKGQRKRVNFCGALNDMPETWWILIGRKMRKV